MTFEDAHMERVADEKETFAWGTGYFTSELPDIWDANFVRLGRTEEDLTAETVATEVERSMAARGFSHRKVTTSDETLGARLAEGFTALGWEVHRHLFMVHDGSPAAMSDIPVDEIVEAVHTVAKDEFNRRDPYIAEQEVMDQMRGLARRISQTTDKRCFAAYQGNEIASVCELYSDGLTAQIEDVATLEEHRNKGLGKAVVLRALHEAQTWGHEMVFLVADDEDWPKDLYRKLGFEDAGRTYQFLLKPKQ